MYLQGAPKKHGNSVTTFMLSLIYGPVFFCENRNSAKSAKLKHLNNFDTFKLDGDITVYFQEKKAIPHLKKIIKRKILLLLNQNQRQSQCRLLIAIFIGAPFISEKLKF